VGTALRARWPEAVLSAGNHVVAVEPEEPTLPGERDLGLPADLPLPDATPDAKAGDVLRDILRRLE
jgi:hypothetical protein